MSAQVDKWDARGSWNPALRWLLGEVFLGFLAIVAAALTLIPLLFNVSSRTNELLEAGQWLIILLFAVEYGMGAVEAPSKRRFVLNPWRLVDAATIVIPLLTLIPGASGLLRSSPVLRLLRLARVIALGARAGSVMTRGEETAAVQAAAAPMQISCCQAERIRNPAGELGGIRAVGSGPGEQWFSLAKWGPTTSRRWRGYRNSQGFHFQTSPGNGYPHAEMTGRHFSLFVWVPEPGSGAP